MSEKKALNPDAVAMHAALSEEYKQMNIALATISSARSALRIAQRNNSLALQAAIKLKDDSSIKLIKDNEKRIVKTLTEVTAIVQRLSGSNLTAMLEYGPYLNKVIEKCTQSGNLTDIAYILDLYNNGALAPIIEQAKELLNQKKSEDENQESVSQEVPSTSDNTENNQDNAGPSYIPESGTESRDGDSTGGSASDSGSME
jgi:hypothetical protein